MCIEGQQKQKSTKQKEEGRRLYLAADTILNNNLEIEVTNKESVLYISHRLMRGQDLSSIPRSKRKSASQQESYSWRTRAKDKPTAQAPLFSDVTEVLNH